MRALVEETDPVVLDGFAESIRMPYPAAAEILAGRAQALRDSSVAVDDAGPAAAPATEPTPATSGPSPSPSLEVPS